MESTRARKLKQVPVGYLIVGVDPHKKKHAAVVMGQDLVVHSKFKVGNSSQGYEELLERARQQMLATGSRGVIFAIETGGHLWRNLAYFLDEKGIPFRLINAFTLKRRREGKDLNRRKNDFRDAEVAAELLRTGEFTETRLPQGVYADLRAAHNAYRRLVKERTRITNLLRGLLDGLFPEFTHVFKDPCGGTALAVLSACATPRAIAAMDEHGFVEAVEATYQGKRLMRRKLLVLHQSAQTSIGIQAGAQSVALELSFLVERLRVIKGQVERAVVVMVRLVDSSEEGKYLLSVRGLNYVSVAGILAELGSFSSYRSAKQMVKMAGTNPTERESAGKRSSHTPMSKKGRPVLRNCLWESVIPLLCHNPDFRSWAKRLRERPVHALNGRAVVGAAMNRLLRLCFALVKKQSLYRMPQLAEMAR